MTQQDKNRLAQLELAQARTEQSKAEFERDRVVNAAVNGAVREANSDAVMEANMRARQSEAQAGYMATSAAVARGEASSERTDASNANFTTVMVIIFAVGIVLAFGIYFFWYVPNQSVVVIKPQQPNNVTINTPSNTPPAQPPANITIDNRANNPAPATSSHKPDTTENPKPMETPDNPEPENPPKPGDPNTKPDPTGTPKGDSDGQ